MNRIKELREDKDLLQKDIADILGIARNTYCEIENNKHELSMNALRILSTFYNVSIDYILYRTDNRKPYKKTNKKISNKSNRIKELRTKNKKSQSEFAKLLSIPKNTYIKYDNMAFNLNIDLLTKLADYFNTSVDYIVYNTDEIKPHKKSIVDWKEK